MLRATSSTEAAWSRLPTRDTIERAAASPLVEGRLISVNVAILGYGAIAREHALALRRIGPGPHGMRGNLTAVMGRLPAPTRAFAEEFGATLATTDLDELLADPRIEAVIVCSPTDLHAEQTERALRAGKHVLCEIPLATSLADDGSVDRPGRANGPAADGLPHPALCRPAHRGTADDRQRGGATTRHGQPLPARQAGERQLDGSPS